MQSCAKSGKDIMTSRQKLLVVLTTPYEHRVRQFEDILAIVRAESDVEGQVAVVKDALAYYGLPDMDDRTPSNAKPTITRQEQEAAGRIIQRMVLRHEIDCCAAFKGKNALEAAREIHHQMGLVEERMSKGTAGAALWLGSILDNPSHTPYTDIVHTFPAYTREEAIVAIVANPDLYAELATLLRGGNFFAVSRWLATVPDAKAQEGLFFYAFSWLGNVMERRQPGLEIVAMIEGSDALREAMAAAASN
jgi:hypothetical protein